MNKKLNQCPYCKEEDLSYELYTVQYFTLITVPLIGFPVAVYCIGPPKNVVCKSCNKQLLKEKAGKILTRIPLNKIIPNSILITVIFLMITFVVILIVYGDELFRPIHKWIVNKIAEKNIY